MAKSSFVEINVENLRLDPINPRLPERLKEANEKDVLNWMLSDATLVDLMASISENGFFSGEPIIAIKEDSSYIVIEGNRRLAAVKLLSKPHIATVSPKAVESLAEEAAQHNNIPKKLWVYLVKSRRDVENYLGFRHVTGVKQWPVISKARYLNQLYEQRPVKTVALYKELAKEIGSKASYVRRLLVGYKAYEIIQSKRFFNIQELSEDVFDISLITDALTMNSAIAEYVGVDLVLDDPFQNMDLKKLTEVTKWLYERLPNGKTKIGENRNLRILNKVLQSTEARDAFVNGYKSLQEAAELTDSIDENIRLLLSKSLQNLIEVQKIIHKSNKPGKDDLRIADEISESASVIFRSLNRKFREIE